MTVSSLLFWLLASCASAPPPPPPQMPASVPPGVIDAFCGLLHGQGMTSEVRVLKTTQPIITSESLQALADQTATRPSKNAFPSLNANPTPIPVEVPSGSCIGHAIDAFVPARDSDVMVLRISSPFSNPFAGGQAGVLARFSLGDEAPSWYWIPIAGRNGRWIAGRPLMLAIR